ncbi:MAG TPA: triphosphoribosyl-dephospho-CoA synthase [Alphaproteobacteria bacterium]|nr:triphosphoribosyl-dephospho-CoA synthase [Alphaproteobacteria bacterium]
MRNATLAAIYRKACLDELRALKPGNVHVHAGGNGMTVTDFELSAEASAAPISATGQPLGRRILDAVTATQRAVGCNTNLGIVLLAAPLLAAAETAPPCGLRSTLRVVLERTTIEDAANTYEAIRLAGPAGLGTCPEQDVRGVPTVDLLKTMILAADRDRVARQYATSYADVFDVGVASLVRARRAGMRRNLATSGTYMAFLAAFPDSHIERKFGVDRAEAVRAEAEKTLATMRSARMIDEEAALLLDFDRRLKMSGCNPGTSADLTVASLLALAIADMLDPVANSKTA